MCRARRPRLDDAIVSAGGYAPARRVWPLYLSRRAFHYSRIFGMLFVLGLASDLLLTRIGWL